MISRALAKSLREAGLVWRPATGDAFQLMAQDAEAAGLEPNGADVFVVSELTIEAHHFPTGTVLGFNGTTEWALDSVAIEDALWLPREDQLREALRDTFVQLDRAGVGWRVGTVFRGVQREYTAESAADAYGLAVLGELAETR